MSKYCNPLRDAQLDEPVGRDDDGNEIYDGQRTINYDGKEIVWESFRDKIKSLVDTEPGALTLALAMDLDITRHE